MRSVQFVLAIICAMALSQAAFGQSWSSASSQDFVKVDWTRMGDSYTFTFQSPIVKDRPYQVIGVSLEPFNIPAPVEVICPEGWTWNGNGGWNQFEVSKESQRYSVDGPSLEPGETLTFVYKVGGNTDLVNSGGPGTAGPAFLTHVLAVNSQKNGKWSPTSTQYGSTWYDVAKTSGFNAVPEPSGLLVISSSVFLFACLRRKQPRV